MQKSQEERNRRETVFQTEFLDDLRHWAGTERKMLLRVLDIVDDIQRDPFVGIGKPKPLRHRADGAWSRRINKSHRILYLVSDGRIDFLQARYHY